MQLTLIIYYLIMYLLLFWLTCFCLISFTNVNYLSEFNLNYFITYIKKYSSQKTLVFWSFFLLSGLPPAGLFFIKLNILVFIFIQLHWLLFFLIFFLFLLNMLYYLQIFKQKVFKKHYLIWKKNINKVDFRNPTNINKTTKPMLLSNYKVYYNLIYLILVIFFFSTFILFFYNDFFFFIFHFL